MAKIFIDMPPFSKKSNGVICIYELYEFLFNRNLDLYFLARNIFEIKHNGISIPYDLDKYNFCLSLEGAIVNDWLIANDTTSEIIIKQARKRGLRIIWWQLAPFKFLGGKVFPKIGEINLPFSSCVDPHAKNFFYYQPHIDKYWKNSLELCSNETFKKDVITIYTGKGRVKELPLEIQKLFRKYDINLISRTYPKSRNAMFKLLLNSIGFITFDELTQLNLEAASIGLPVFVVNQIFPDIVYKKFPVKSLGERVTSNPEHFLELLEKSKNNRLDKFYISDLIQNNKNTLNNIFEILTENDKQLFLSQKDLERLKNWTSFLKNKNMIHPHLNGGQSAGSLFIEKYCSNLIKQKNSNLLNMKILLLEEICKFLFENNLLPVILFISQKVSKFIVINKLIDKFNLRYLRYKFDKNYAYSLFHKSSKRWSNNKLSLNQIIENPDKISYIYDDNLHQNQLSKVNKLSVIRFSRNKLKKYESKKNKLKSIQNIFENSYLSFPKSSPFKIKYKIFGKED